MSDGIVEWFEPIYVVVLPVGVYTAILGNSPGDTVELECCAIVRSPVIDLTFEVIFE